MGEQKSHHILSSQINPSTKALKIDFHLFLHFGKVISDQFTDDDDGDEL